MSRTVFCQKLKKSAEGLTYPPYPGALGRKIFDNISAEAWRMWLNYQTMLINEYHLDVSDPQVRKQLAEKMENFLFNKEETVTEIPI